MNYEERELREEGRNEGVRMKMVRIIRGGFLCKDLVREVCGKWGI